MPLALSENSRRLWLSEVLRTSLLERVFRQISTLLENDSPIFRQCEMLFLPRFGHFPARKTLLENWRSLRECCWIFSSETATAFLSSSDSRATPSLRLWDALEQKTSLRLPGPHPKRLLYADRRTQTQTGADKREQT